MACTQGKPWLERPLRVVSSPLPSGLLRYSEREGASQKKLELHESTPPDEVSCPLMLVMRSPAAPNRADTAAMGW